ncbi:MAG: hypothetical protein F6J97_15940 [Leptolyngbya sp. SIO4C1]|nr:hypothetical protein [Leptolyngbya sp. SIO4C1]
MKLRLARPLRRLAEGFLLAVVAMALIAGCRAQATSVVGWVETVRLPGIDAAIAAKMDTGATTASINADILQQPDSETESGGMIRFKFKDDDGHEAIYERPIVRWVKIKDGDGGFFRRPVVQMRFCVAGQWLEAEVNLADREQFNYAILVGRNMLKQGGLTVSSAETYLTAPRCSH